MNGNCWRFEGKRGQRRVIEDKMKLKSECMQPSVLIGEEFIWILPSERQEQQQQE